MLLLTAPAQHIAENPAVEQDPKRVKQWLEKLPVDDVQLTVSELVTALKPFNELQLDVKTRLRLLEIYHTAFDTILYTYDELHLRTLPLNVEQRRKLSDDIMWVYLELANGYKSIIKAVYEGDDKGPSERDVSLSIYRAIELISNALLYAFRDHQTPPPLVYLEIHQLYFLAEQYQIEKEVINNLKNRSSKSTILHLYKHIMLLIAGDAYGYDGGQINELYMLLEAYTDECKLVSTAPKGQKYCKFYIDFTEDTGPRNCLNMDIALQVPTQRILEMTSVVERLIADINKNKNVPRDSIQAQEHRLLRLFIDNLNQDSHDREQRKPCKDSARVAYGVEVASYYLNHRDKFFHEKVEAVSGIEVRDIDMFEAEHELSTWQVVNATPRGRMLVTEQTDSSYYSAGEVVSIVEFLSDTREHLLNTGLIRWLRYVDDKVNMGIEFLPGAPIGVTCYAAMADDEPVTFPGLYFPSNKENKQPASLLFEFSYFRYARSFRVDVYDQSYRIEPVRIIKESPIHIQFSFRIIK